MKTTLRLSLLCAIAGVACASESPIEASSEEVRTTIHRDLEIAADVIVPQDDAAFVDAFAIADDPLHLRLHYDGPAAVTPRVGEILVGNVGPGFMGEVLSIEEDGNDLIVELEPVGLDRVILDGSFTVDARPTAGDRVVMTGPNGEEIVGRQSAFSGGFNFVNSAIAPGTACAGSGQGNVDLVFDYNFDGVDTSWDVDIKKKRFLGISIPTGLNSISGTLTASGNASVQVIASGNADISCYVDLVDLAHIPSINWSKRFSILGLPITIRFTLKPSFTVEGDIKIDPTTFEATLAADASVSLTAGWRSGDGVFTNASFTPNLRWDLDAANGEGTAMASVNLDAGVTANLALTGFTFPEGSVEFHADASITTDDAACTYEWTAGIEANAGLNGRLGLADGIPFVGGKGWDIAKTWSFARRVSGGDSLDLPYCDPDPCTTDDDCIGTEDHCDTEAMICVECLEDSHCDGDATCGSDHRCDAGNPYEGITSCGACIRAGGEFCLDSNTCVEVGDSCSGTAATNLLQCIPCSGYTSSCVECAGHSVCGWDRDTNTCFNIDAEREDHPNYAANAGRCG